MDFWYFLLKDDFINQNSDLSQCQIKLGSKDLQGKLVEFSFAFKRSLCGFQAWEIVFQRWYLASLTNQMALLFGEQ